MAAILAIYSGALFSVAAISFSTRVDVCKNVLASDAKIRVPMKAENLLTIQGKNS